MKVFIFIIGLGNMGSSIVRALTSASSEYEIYAADKNSSNLEKLAIEYGIKSDRSYSELNKADTVILAVKPQDLAVLAEEIKDKISKDSILISIAAGTSIGKIQKLFEHDKIVRMMPNIGLRVGEGIAAWKASGLSGSEKETARELLNGLTGNFEIAKEELLDAVTAVSGSGPAYFFLLAQALERSARSMGLAESEARLLVEKTLSAAAKLQSGKSYDELIAAVASKGGTTEAALEVLEKEGFAQMIEEAVRAAHARSKKLSHE